MQMRNHVKERTCLPLNRTVVMTRRKTTMPVKVKMKQVVQIKIFPAYALVRFEVDDKTMVTSSRKIQECHLAQGKTVMVRWKEGASKTWERLAATVIAASDDERALKSLEVRLAEDEENADPQPNDSDVTKATRSATPSVASEVDTATAGWNKRKATAPGTKKTKRKKTGRNEQAVIEESGEAAPASDVIPVDMPTMDRLDQLLSDEQQATFHELMTAGDGEGSKCCEHCQKRDGDIEFLKKSVSQLLAAVNTLTEKLTSVQDSIADHSITNQLNQSAIATPRIGENIDSTPEPAVTIDSP
ncbi:uncharacterized protein [Ptychodera flava]|uniref:uncharacterized protein isoform X2 n=1 Tax=Ptychodera flava TaxID=63121 RepID=UPI00396A2735